MFASSDSRRSSPETRRRRNPNSLKIERGSSGTQAAFMRPVPMKAMLHLAAQPATPDLIPANPASSRAASSAAALMEAQNNSSIREGDSESTPSFHSILHEYRGSNPGDSNDSRQDSNQPKQKSAAAIPARQAQAGAEIIRQNTANSASDNNGPRTSRGSKSIDSNGSQQDSTQQSDSTKQKNTDTATAPVDSRTDSQEVLPLAAKLPAAQDQSGSQDNTGNSQGDSQQPNDSSKHNAASEAALVYFRSREIVPLSGTMPGAIPAALSENTPTDSGPQLSQSQVVIPVPASTEIENDAAPAPASNPQPERAAALPAIETSNANQPASTGPIAMAAKLTPAETQGTDAAPADSQPADTGDGKSRGQNTLLKQPAAIAVQDDPNVKVSGDPVQEHFSKAEAAFAPPTPAASSTVDASAVGKGVTGQTTSPSSQTASQMQPLIETPAQATGSGHDITIKLPDASERGMDVRFVERGGEVHVAIRTSDGEMAQTLRSGLNDFVGRMDHAGIRAEVWRPGAEASSSQNSQQDANRQQTQDQRGSRNQSGSQDSESDSPNSKKPRWVEALEDSIGSQSTLPSALQPSSGQTA